MFQNLKNLAYGLLPIQKRFERINSRNQWGNAESVSGVGSTMANTENIRAALPPLFQELGVKKVIDIACGDFNWMSRVVADTGVAYIGFDIVPAQVSENTKRHGTDRIRFAECDITSRVPTESGDLVILRDCMLHLSFAHGLTALDNLSRIDATWVMMSTYKGVERNRDIVSGRHRAVSMTLPPYDLPPPVRSIDENERDKELALWRVADLAARG